MKIEPLVSVIVAVSTNEETIYGCIESIMEQSYHNLEIILVIDNSYDRINIICNNLALMDSRIQIVNLIQNKKNKDDLRISAFYEGLQHASGSLITFVDSNDRIQKDMIRILVGISIKYQCQIACCKMSLCKEDKAYCPSKREKIRVYRRNAAFMSRRFSSEPYGKLFDIYLFEELCQSTFFLYPLYYRTKKFAIIEREMYFRHYNYNNRFKKNIRFRINAIMKYYKDRIQYFKNKERNLLELSHEYYCEFLADYYIHQFRSGTDANILERIYTDFRREYRVIRYNTVTPLYKKWRLDLLYHVPKLYVIIANILRINTDLIIMSKIDRL